MALEFINKYPKLTFLLIGLLILIPISLGMSTLYDKLIEEKQSRIEELRTKLIEREATIVSLTEYTKTLKKQSKTIKIIKPNGEIIEESSDSLESQIDISQKVQEEYKEKISIELRKIHEEYSKKVSERKKLNLAGGYTLDQEIWLGASYNVWGPFTINGNMVFGKTQHYLLGIGWEL